MRKTFFRFVAASCVLGFFPAMVEAQVRQPEQPDQAAQQPDREPATQQRAPAGEERQQRQGDEPFEARRIDPSAARSQGPVSVQDYLATKLMLANKAEIELSQLATEKTQNEEIKQFAQMMVKDHQQMNEKLQQLTSGQRASGVSTPGTPGASQDPARRSPARAEQTDRPDRAADARDRTESPDQPRLTRGDQASEMVPQQLTQVTRQAAEKHLQMSKEALQQKEGQDFDMGYLSMQVGAHMHMLAGLQAIQNVGSQEFQQLVSQAEQKTNEHLDQAKQLAKKLEDDRKAARQGSEPDAQPSRRSGVDTNRGSN